MTVTVGTAMTVTVGTAMTVTLGTMRTAMTVTVGTAMTVTVWTAMTATVSKTLGRFHWRERGFTHCLPLSRRTVLALGIIETQKKKL